MQHNLPFHRSHTLATFPFELIHVDLWGLHKHVALNGAHYLLTIVDDHRSESAPVEMGLQPS